MRWRYQMAFVTVLLVGAVAVSALASGNARRVVGDCTKSQVRPSSIVLACADDNLVLTHLQWSSFGASEAKASGDYYVNGCTPDCAAGKFRSYPIKLTLSAARECPDGHNDYREAAFTFLATKPRGAASSYALFCPLPG
ncbi:MAG: hypothetical protein ABR947_07650 [Solirubrobacteraceae bacterium]